MVEARAPVATIVWVEDTSVVFLSAEVMAIVLAVRYRPSPLKTVILFFFMSEDTPRDSLSADSRLRATTRSQSTPTLPTLNPQ